MKTRKENKKQTQLEKNQKVIQLYEKGENFDSMKVDEIKEQD